MPSDRLNPYSPKGKKIIIGGEAKEQYWEDAQLHRRYENGTAFITEIVRRFEHIRTDSRSVGVFVSKEKRDQDEAEFKNWFRNELRHKELHACYENSTNEVIQDVKRWLTNQR